MSEKFKITFIFEDGKTPNTVIEARRGDSILDTALDNNINLHHNCGGVCACSTCHVYIEKGMENLPELSDSEENFIDRAVNPKLSSRLACQCEINGDVTVIIPDQSVHIGH